MQFFIQRREGVVYRLHRSVRVLMLGLILVFQFGPVYLMMANPLGEEVAAGQANFDRAGSTLTITTSDRVIINWQDFSIASGELTKFVQPSVSSAALNRVVSGNPSQIFGTLQANGQIFLINPNGILIGNGAVINTGGFTASTLDLNNSEFMSGGNMNFVGGSTAGIENQGKINAIGGDIILIAHEVNNSGELQAPNGVIGLAAGHDILMAQAGSEKVFVRPTVGAGTPSSHGILNSGVLAAARVELKAHGNLYALAINNGGVIRADGATIGENGRVMLIANGGHVVNTGMIAANGANGGTVSVKAGEAEIHGSIEARGASGTGGAVTITGEKVGVSAATIDASGKTGGGTVKIGGDVHGANPDIANATTTSVAKDATIKADATDTGNGGEVVVWADGKTDFEGVILARGGQSGGNGGFAEVSGKNLLNFKGKVDLLAPSGTTGMLLLDPKNIAVTAAGTDPVAGNSQFNDNPGGWSLISGADLSTAIDSASVTLQANTDIFINDDVTGTTAGNGLTLQAGRSISIEQNTTISLNGGDFSATINDNGAQVANRDAGPAVFSMENNAQVLTGGGNFTVNHGNLDGTGVGQVRLGFNTANDGTATISTGAGDVNISGTGQSASTGQFGIVLGNPFGGAHSVIQTTTGGITLNGTGGAGTDNNVGVYIYYGDLLSSGGDVSVTGTGGGTGDMGRGIYFGLGTIQTAGAGTIAIVGDGSPTGTIRGQGVLIDSLTNILSVDGNITIQGTGAGSGDFTYGVNTGGTTVQSSGTGAINVVGQASASGGDGGVGIYLGGASLSADSGAISLTGTGAGSGANCYGIDGLVGSITSTGSSAITLSGTGVGGANGIHWANFGSTTIGGPASTGDITFAAETTAGSDSISLSGMSIEGTGNLFLKPINAATGIGVAGGSGDFNLSSSELDLIQNGFSKITIGLSNGTGSANVGSYTFSDSVKIQSASFVGDGAISVAGALATSGLGDTIELYGGKAVTISGGSVTTNNGDITILGNASDTYPNWTMGVDLNTGASVSSGSGDILVVGNGGDGAGDWKIGIRAQGSSIQSTSGDITLQGGGGANDSFNPGILVEWGGGQVTTATGNILMVGNGGGVGSNNWGISIADGGAVTATGSGTITLTGTGGSGTEVNYGVKITGGGLVSVDSGNLQITGTVNAPTDRYNHGVDIDTAGQVLSNNGGTITIDGIGGAGTHDNHGVRIADNNTLVQSSTGNILINGLGGAGSQEANRGIVVEGGADIQSTGNATITLDGDGGLGAWGNHGILIAGGGTTITSSGGNITIDGLGADAAGGWNNGVWIFAGAHIDATNGAGVSVSGLAGNAGANGDNWGIMMEDAGTRITAVNGNIALSGIGRGTTDQNNVGLYIRNGVEVSSTGAGSISLSGSGAFTVPGIVVTGGSNVFGGPSATGAMTLTAHTATGADSISLANATFQSSGELTLQPLNAGTTIGLAGESGTFNLSNAELALFQDGFSRITIGLAAGTGDVQVGAYTFSDPVRIQTAAAGGAGVITINGALATSGGNDAIELYAGRGVVLNSGVTTNDGDITIKGNESGTATGFSFGVDINAVTVSAGTGNVVVVGHGGDTGDFNIGIRLTNGGSIQTTNGNITLTGTGGAGGNDNWGTLLEWNSSVSTSSGDIMLTGTGGGTGFDNYGVLIQGASSVSNNTGTIGIDGTGSSSGTSGNQGVRIDFSGIASTDGAITVTGQGGGSSNDNYGIFVVNGSTIDSFGAATITLDGTGGDGSWWNVGTYLINSGTAISSTTGDVSITGQGGSGSNDSNFGIYMAGGAVVQSAGTAKITLTGTGGGGTWGNHGIGIVDPGSSVTTVDGDITMNGTGGAGSQGWNVGLRLQNGVLVQSTGAGQLNLTGNGAAGVEDNWGFWMDGATVTSSNANINITGTGAGTAQTNFGIYLQNGALVENLGSGDITLIGTGGDADWGNHGVFLVNAGTDVCVTDGNLLIQGFGGNGVGGFNVGVQINDFAIAESCGAGFVTIEGTGGNGTSDNWGFWGFNAGVASNTGDISITGIGNGSGATNYGIYLETGTQILAYDSANITLDARGAGVAAGFKSANSGNLIGSLTTGDIILTASTATGADSIDMAGIDFAGNNNLVLQPLNAATTIGLGNSATGVFNLSDTEIAMIDPGFAGVIVGRSGGSGAMDIRSATWNSPLADLRTSGPVTLQGALTTSGNGSFNFNKAISLAGATSVDTTGSNGNITFANAVTGGQSLTLDSGAGVISIAAGLTVSDLSITTTDISTLTQGAAWNVSGTMNLNMGGPVTLNSGGNSIADLGTISTAGSFSLVNVGGLSISGPIAATGGDVTIRTSGVMLINGTVAGDNVTLVTGNSFVNMAGATPFTLNGGRFLIYSVDPALNTLGGLLYDFSQTAITYPTAPAIAVGNGLLYSIGTPAPGPDNGYIDPIFSSFSDSYDRSTRFEMENQNLANYGSGRNTIGYGPPPPLGPLAPGVYISVSSFNVPGAQ